MRNLVLVIIILMPSLGYCELLPFVPVKNQGFYDSSSFSWDANKNHYSLNEDGVLVLTSNKLSSSRKLKLPVNAFVVRLSFLNYSGDILLAMENDFAGEGHGYICRVKKDLATVRWCKNIPAFNVMASVSNDSIWIGAIGFVARINQESGEFYWNQNGLYRYCADREDEDSFNSVWPASETATTIIFDSEGSNPGNKRQLLVEKESGKILHAKDINSNRICPKFQESVLR